MVRSMMAMATVVALAASTAEAHGFGFGGGKGGGCCYSAPCCAPTTCYKTVMVPEWYTELCTVQCVEYKHEPRERTVTWCEYVPVKTVVPYEYTVCKTHWETKVHTYHVQVPVWSEVEQTYYVSIPYTVKKQGVRKVPKVIQVPKSYEVCVDQGHWEQKCSTVQTCGYSYGCGGCCAPCCVPCTTTCCYKVWVPNIVKQVVNYTACETICVDEPFEYDVTLCRQEPRTRLVKVCSYKTEPRTCEVKYPVHVPVKMTGTREVCTYNTVHKSRVETYTVCVPVCVEKQVEVRKCRMVCKTVAVQCCQPVCCSYGCGH